MCSAHEDNPIHDSESADVHVSPSIMTIISKEIFTFTMTDDYVKQVMKYISISIPGRVAQSVTCLSTDACLTADPGVASSIPVRSHTFVEIDHEMISTVILLPSADSFKKGCCQ